MTDRNELAELIEALRERLHAAIKDPVYEVAASPLFMAAAQLLGKCRDEIAALRAPALPSEEEIRRKILDAIESSQVGGLNAEGEWIMMPIDGFNGYINGLRAALALLGKTGGEK